jgi:hypothetical protein
MFADVSTASVLEQKGQQAMKYLPKKIKELVMVRDGHRCRYCYRDGQLLMIDHIRPKSNFTHYEYYSRPFDFLSA